MFSFLKASPPAPRIESSEQMPSIKNYVGRYLLEYLSGMRLIILSAKTFL